MPNGKPNILVIWGDDIGISNLSCYSDGMMGYRTPNIDRIANEGMLFTDSYGEQSCTAGRAAFISGQSVYRTGMSKVGVPGVDIGWAAEDPTIAELLKPLGYATGQFGKNHFGDLNKYLPTVHGFDEFYGNLYHLNAEEEPENVRLPAQGHVPRAARAGAAARRAQLQGHRRGLHRTGRRTVRTRRQADHRGHRPADRQADGDHRRRHRRRAPSTSSSASTRRTPRSSCGATSPTCTSTRTPSRRAGARPACGSRSTTTR